MLRYCAQPEKKTLNKSDLKCQWGGLYVEIALCDFPAVKTRERGCWLETLGIHFNAIKIIFKNCSQNWNKQGFLKWPKQQQLVSLEKLWFFLSTKAEELHKRLSGQTSLQPVEPLLSRWVGRNALVPDLQPPVRPYTNQAELPGWLLLLTAPGVQAHRQVLLSHTPDWSHYVYIIFQRLRATEFRPLAGKSHRNADSSLAVRAPQRRCEVPGGSGQSSL